MKKIVIAPDSFKGTMSSVEVCDITETAIRKILPEADVIKMPIADGGEGTVEAFLCAVGGTKKHVTVKDPFMRDTDAYYAVLDDGGTAVIEMAQASGLPLLGEEKNAVRATSFGTGQMILDAVASGCRKIIMGIGGSATVDGGIGAAAALEIRFLDGDGNDIDLNGGGLAGLVTIETEGLDKRMAGVELLIACDVDNVLCGQNGAARVYGPQKGADPAEVELLDNNLARYAEVLEDFSGVDYAQVKGTGAAGGIGVSLMAFTGAKLVPGIDLVIETIRMEEALRDADLVITGEGRMDSQSLQGKVPIGVARLAKRHGVPVVAVVGSVADGLGDVYAEGITAVFATVKDTVPFEIARNTCREDLAFAIESLMRFTRVPELL